MSKHKVGDKAAVIRLDSGGVSFIYRVECVRVTAGGQTVWKSATDKQFRFTANDRHIGDVGFSYAFTKLETDPEAIAVYSRQYHRKRLVDELRGMGARVNMETKPQDLLTAVAMMRAKINELDVAAGELMRDANVEAKNA